MAETVTGDCRAVRCMKPGCSLAWPRDPILEVSCPDCKARVGASCKRPSGHRAWGGYHAARDILADQQGKYGTCPFGRCGLAAQPAVDDLFPGTGAMGAVLDGLASSGHDVLPLFRRENRATPVSDTGGPSK